MSGRTGMSAVNGTNYHLKEEIKAYWSARAATFDASPGHGTALPPSC